METVARNRTASLWVIGLLAAALMIVRVDWWWWGTKIEPLYFGWLSLPMLYQLAIWFAGWGLVVWICSLWDTDE